ncbi:chemotaxis protein CheW [Hymenobacter volaticus]|uniref:chemotaxis protein CheW n=1 Tax=Hymenobacter volaticus TaxID=2932254 RepID=UPI00246980C6|nr:chemotaxis protein CheW [Hymenobacter volaticus]
MPEAEQNSDKKTLKPDAIIQLIVFRLGDEEYGLRIEQVKEVTITPEVARMPKTPPFIKGIANGCGRRGRSYRLRRTRWP